MGKYHEEKIEIMRKYLGKLLKALLIILREIFQVKKLIML